MPTEAIQNAVLTMRRRVPFQPFVLDMENGDRILIEHPENIAFDPGGKERAQKPDFSVISRQVYYLGTFEAVTSVARSRLGRACSLAQSSTPPNPDYSRDYTSLKRRAKNGKGLTFACASGLCHNTLRLDSRV